MIISLSAITISVAYTVYHYRDNIRSIIITNSKSSLQNSQKNQRKEYSTNITAISEDFMNIVNQFKWEKQDKDNFIEEMLALSPSERQSILNEMLEKSK